VVSVSRFKSEPVFKARLLMSRCNCAGLILLKRHYTAADLRFGKWGLESGDRSPQWDPRRGP